MKRKLTAATSLALALTLPMSASAYGNHEESNDITHVLEQTIDSSSENDVDFTTPSDSIENFIVHVPKRQPIEVEEILADTEEVIGQKYELVAEKYANSLESTERNRMIDNMAISPILKDVLKSMVGFFPNSTSAEVFVEMIHAHPKELPDLLVIFFEAMYNGAYTHVSNTGQTVVYPGSTIKIFDNTAGTTPLAKCMYMLEDPSVYGNYRIYKQNIAPHGGIIGTDIVITDTTGHILICLHNYRLESSYAVVKDQNLYVTSLEDYLTDIDLTSRRQDTYNYKDLFDLQLAISAQVGNFDTTTKDSYNPDEVLVVEVPESTSSWFISSLENERRYYFLEKRGKYLFGESTYICASLFHEDAYALFDETGVYGLVYRDNTEKITMNCDNSNPIFYDIVPLSQFLQEKTKDCLNEGHTSELALLYDELTEPKTPVDEKTMRFKPVD